MGIDFSNFTSNLLQQSFSYQDSNDLILLKHRVDEEIDNKSKNKLDIIIETIVRDVCNETFDYSSNYKSNLIYKVKSKYKDCNVLTRTVLIEKITTNEEIERQLIKKRIYFS